MKKEITPIVIVSNDAFVKNKFIAFVARLILKLKNGKMIILEFGPGENLLEFAKRYQQSYFVILSDAPGAVDSLLTAGFRERIFFVSRIRVFVHAIKNLGITCFEKKGGCLEQQLGVFLA